MNQPLPTVKPSVTFHKSLVFPFTCPLCDEVFQYGTLDEVGQLSGDDRAVDGMAVHIHKISFHACIPCCNKLILDDEGLFKPKIEKLFEVTIPEWCECRFLNNVVGFVVARN